MKQKKTHSALVDDVIHEMQDKLTKYETKIEGLVITEKQARYFDEQLQRLAEKTLNTLFGKQRNPQEKGLIGLNFNENYKRAVEISCWRQNEHLLDEHYRVNSFYKGLRWSNEKKKKNFYKVFFTVRNLVRNPNNKYSLVPVSFWNGIGKRLGVGRIRIQSESINDTNRFVKCINLHEDVLDIILPDLKDWQPGFAIDSQGEMFWTKFGQYTVTHHNNIMEEAKSVPDFDAVLLSESAPASWTEAALSWINCYHSHNKSKRLTLMENILTEIQKFLSDHSIEDITKTDVFGMIVLYQLYDLPYAIEMFLPKGINDIPSDFSGVMFSTECNDNNFHEKILENEEVLLVLANSMYKLGKISANLWRKASKLTTLKNDLYRLYSSNKADYKRMAASMEIILYALLKNFGVQKISSRVKDFSSLFEKLVEKMIDRNGKDDTKEKSIYFEFYDKENNKMDFFEVEQFLPNDLKCRVEDLVSKVKSGEIDSLTCGRDNVFLGILDIIGVMIICEFWDTVDSIDKVLQKLPDKAGIKAFSTGEQKLVKSCLCGEKETGYRAKHYFLAFNDVRNGLIEFDGLDKLVVELQVTSILAHGANDISHDLSYKPNIGDVARPVQGVKNDVADCQKIINSVDDHLVQCKHVLSEGTRHKKTKNLKQAVRLLREKTGC